MANNLQTIRQDDFSGGGNWITSFLDLKENQLAELNNLALTIHGEMITRPGIKLVSTLPDAAAKVAGFDILNQTDTNTSIGIAIQQGVSGDTVSTSLDGITWTPLSPVLTSWAEPYLIPFVNNMFISSGPAQVPQLYNGTTLTSITATGAGQTVPPGALHAIQHLNSLWLWGTAPTTTAIDGPSSLRVSGVNDPNDWPNENQTFLAKDDGQIATGISIFTLAETGISPAPTLVLFKNFSTYQVTGLLGAADFIATRAKTDLGCIAPKSVQFITGFGVIRLTHKGFAIFDGVNDILVSEEVRPLIFGDVGIYGQVFSGIKFDPFDPESVLVAWSMQSQNPPMYLCGVPVSGTEHFFRVFAYDLVRKAWSVWQFPIDFSAFSMSHIGIQATEKRLFGGTQMGGRIYEFRSDQFTDNGLPILWSFITRAYHLGDPLRKSYWRRFLIIFQTRTSGAGQTVTMHLHFPDHPPIVATADSPVDPGNLIAAASVNMLVKSPLVIVRGEGAGAFRTINLEFQASPEPLTEYRFGVGGQTPQPVPPSGVGNGTGGGGGSGGGGVGGGSNNPLYHFVVRDGEPNLHDCPHQGSTLQDFQLAASQEDVVVVQFPGDHHTLNREDVWWCIAFVGSVGNTLTIPLRQFPIGTGVRATSLPLGWYLDTVSYTESGTPTQNGYGPHPTTTNGYTLVARAATFAGSTIAAIKSNTYNNPPIVGDILASLTFASGLISAYADRPDLYTLVVPNVGGLAGVVLRIENHPATGTPHQTYPSGPSSPFAFSRAGTVELA